MADIYSSTTRNNIEQAIADNAVEMARCAAFGGEDITTRDGRTISRIAYRQELMRELDELITVRKRVSPIFIGRIYGRQAR